jgi:hypothetical protein
MSKCPLCKHEVIPCVVQEVVSQTNYEATLDEGGFLIADTSHPRRIWDSKRYYERYFCPDCQKPLTEKQVETMLTEPAHTYLFEELAPHAQAKVIGRYRKIFGENPEDKDLGTIGRTPDYIIVEIIHTEPEARFYADGTLEKERD